MRIVHISDFHINSASEVIYGVNTLANLREASDRIRSIGNLDAVIVSGDISDDGKEESYHIADSVLAGLGCPIWAVPGNHDDKELIRSIQLGGILFPEETILCGYRFIFLDSVVPDPEDGGNKSRGLISDDDMARLKEMLNASPAPTVVVLHHPSIEQGGGWIDRRMLVNRDQFNRTVTENGHVIAVLSGHYHCSATDYLAGRLFSIAPGVSTTFGKYLKPFEEAYTPGFDILDFDGDYITKKTVNLQVSL